jgi:hypothetical protein
MVAPITTHLLNSQAAAEVVALLLGVVVPARHQAPEALVAAVAFLDLR